MAKFDFKDKTFSLVENSENGRVNPDTIFKFEQEGNLVTADYYGGGIRYGKIISVLNGHTLDMRYQCLTDTGELKAGKAVAQINVTEENKIELHLDWEWLGESRQKGTSKYIEL